MYKFNNNNIVTGYIKELLRSFNLPQVHVLTPGCTVFPNCTYVYKNNLYKYKGEGALKLSEDLTSLPSLLVAVKNYFYGQNILNLTKNLTIENPIYESYTHEYLGDYLRFHRDYMGINLMSMYNCFSNRMAKLLNITVENSLFSSDDISSKIFIVPVKLFQEYTIGIDCDTKIEIFSGFYSDGLVTIIDKTTDESFYSRTYEKKIGTRFKKPFVYSKLKNIENVLLSQYNKEEKLVLVLKVPFSCESSITVLEGNFLENSNIYFENQLDRVSNLPLLYKYNNVEMTQYNYLSRPQLLSMNSFVSYPFADRLVEYLFGNVVDNSDAIGENIKRVQTILLKGRQKFRLNGVDKYGEWNNAIRNALYANEILLGLIHKSYDTIGFYDKTIEEALGE